MAKKTTELANKRIEREYFSFQIACEAIENAFPGFEDKITTGLVEMLAFDCLIGHNDRHPYNWGVVVPLLKRRRPRFAPIYDTARALFWNVPEARVTQMIRDKNQLESYINKCAPPLSWDGEPNVDFFRLMGLIWNHSDNYRCRIEKLLTQSALDKSVLIIDQEFGRLMSNERRQLIQECLRTRYQRLSQTTRN